MSPVGHLWRHARKLCTCCHAPSNRARESVAGRQMLPSSFQGLFHEWKLALGHELWAPNWSTDSVCDEHENAMPSMRTIKPAIKWISSGKQAAFYRFECIRINKVKPLLIGNPPLTQSFMIFPVAFNIHCTEFVLHLAITPALIKGTPLPNG